MKRKIYASNGAAVVGSGKGDTAGAVHKYSVRKAIARLPFRVTTTNAALHLASGSGSQIRIESLNTLHLLKTHRTHITPLFTKPLNT